MVARHHLAEHLAGDLADVSRTLGEMHSPFKAVIESPLSAPSGVDLGFHDHEVGANFFCDGLRRFS